MVARSWIFLAAIAIAVSACSRDRTVDARVTSLSDSQVCFTFNDGGASPDCLDRADSRMEVPESVSVGACLRLGLAGESFRIRFVRWVECTSDHWKPADP